jgi:hypothetical protein
VVAFLIALLGPRFEPLLPYLKCLLFGFHGVKNSCSNGDGLYHVSDGRERKKVYDALRRAGLRYDENVRALIREAASMGILSHLIDLSLDATHLMYHGTKRLREWEAPFSTWLNRSFPGLSPTTAYDLASGLFLYMFDFVSKASLSNRTYGKGKVMLGRVKGCVEFLEEASIRVRSVTGDEAFFSYALLKWLVESKKMSYRIAVSSRSVLREYMPRIEEWVSMEDGRLIGIFRGAVYQGDQDEPPRREAPRLHVPLRDEHQKEGEPREGIRIHQELPLLRQDTLDEALEDKGARLLLPPPLRAPEEDSEGAEPRTG